MTILKGIPSIISPQLLHVLAQMGHGDELVLADANFPSTSIAKHTTLGSPIAYDSSEVPTLLKAILELLPLDDPGLGSSVAVMALMNVHVAAGWKEPPVWATFQAIVDSAENRKMPIEQVERFTFYERAKRAFCVIATG
jgi:L-fucose mutarotase